MARKIAPMARMQRNLAPLGGTLLLVRDPVDGAFLIVRHEHRAVRQPLQVDRAAGHLAICFEPSREERFIADDLIAIELHLHDAIADGATLRFQEPCWAMKAVF